MRRSTAVAAANLGFIGLAVIMLVSASAEESTGRPLADCLQQDSSLILYAQRLATDPDPRLDATRQRYDISLVPVSQVVRITNSSICSDAGRAYKSAVGLKGKAPDVEVVRVGDRYIVRSPAGKPEDSEFTSHVVFDLELNEIAVFAG